MTALSDFRRHDTVRLLYRHGDVRAGTRGHVLGRYAREIDPTYLVSFEDKQVCNDVRFNEIVLTDDFGTAA